MARSKGKALVAPVEDDVESRAVDTAHLVDSEADEASPLLASDMAASMVPDKSFRRLVLLMCAWLLFVIEVGQFILVPALKEVMEDIICRKHYPDHVIGLYKEVDKRCKDNSVQKTLAMVSAWSLSANMFIPFLCQIPYGMIADKYGRRPVLFLSLFGTLLQTLWTLLVLKSPDTFSIWVILYGTIFCFIGGGGQMVAAMVYTIIADVVQVSERTDAFYILNGSVLLLTVICNPIAAWLMEISPWLAVWLGFGFLVSSLIPGLLLPETLVLHKKADHVRRRGASLHSSNELAQRGFVAQIWFSAKNDMHHIWEFVFASKKIMVLCIGYGVFYAVKLTMMEQMLQYMTKRYNWTWPEATRISTIGSATSLVVLMVVLPAVTYIFKKKVKLAPLSRDLYLSRVSALLMVVGTLIASLAATRTELVVSLVVNAFGSGLNAQLRALINALVEPHTIATINTLLSCAEALIMMLASPVMGWLLSKGMDIGGIWMGLPFMVALLPSLLVTGLLFLFRLPKYVPVAQ